MSAGGFTRLPRFCPPMWKLMDSPASCAAAHNESQCGSQSAGWPKSCGWLGNSTARCPARALRTTSATHASRSQNGSAITASRRPLSALHQSMRKSLYARMHSSLSSGSSSRVTKVCEPKPPTLG